MTVDYIRQFNKTLENLDYGRRPVEKFRDFCTMAALSFAQPFYRSEELEKEYMQVSGRYKPEQLTEFAKLIAIVVNALEENPDQDFLGTCFMQNEMGNEYRGQFFTPYSVCKMMAEINYGRDFVNNPQGYVTVCEPCSGAGALIIALRNTVIKQGLNPSTCMLVTATDIDEICFKMSYIQFSLLAIPAVVIHGNTLAVQEFRSLYTPAYFYENWPERIKTGMALEKLRAIFFEDSFNNTTPMVQDKPEPEKEIIIQKNITEEVKELKQLSLF